MRQVLVYIGILWATTLLLAASAKGAAPIVYVQNQSREVSDKTLADALPAFRASIDQDFAPVWGITATLALVPHGVEAPPGSWTITLSDEVDCFACQGYHNFDGGAPYAKVFPGLSDNWEVTLSHELEEMLADPFTDRAVHTRRGWYLVEVADPVEALSFAYWRTGLNAVPVALSDFVYPSWYTDKAGAPYDYQRRVIWALQVLPGGYFWKWIKGWYQPVTGKAR